MESDDSLELIHIDEVKKLSELKPFLSRKKSLFLK